MAKICGYISTGESQETIAGYLRSMARIMEHDPKSNEEYICFDNGGIVLIANSSSTQAQSIWKQDRSSCLALCGHVIDYKGDSSSLYEHEYETSRDNDASALLHAFEAGGEDILDKLNGTFCFAYFKSETGSLTVVNDRYGFMPLYYYYDKNRFLFSSEVKSILQVVRGQEFDWESFADFFYIGHMMGHKTLFKNVRALNPGQILTYCNGSLQKSEYYDFTKTAVLSHEEVSTEKLALLFTEAVRKRIERDIPNTVLLSGGFDSRLILGALDKLRVNPKIISLEHVSEHQGADGILASRMANSLGLACDYRKTRKHFLSSKDSLEVFYILDGMAPTFSLFIGEVYPELDNTLGMVWDGLALDVGLGGSHQSEGGSQKNLKRFIKSRVLNRLLLRIILSPQQFHAMDNSFMRRLQGEIAKIPVSTNQFLYFLLKNRTRRRIAPNPYKLFTVKVDPVTPATDINFMDYVLGIPSSLKLSHKLYIDMLRNNFPSLTKVPVVSGGAMFDFDGGFRKKRSILSKERLQRVPKHILKVLRWISANYIDRSHALINDYDSAELMIMVLEIKMFDRPFYNRKILRQLFAAYRRGNGIYHKLFTIVFYIELWHLLFVDQDSPIYFDPKNINVRGT